MKRFSGLESVRPGLLTDPVCSIGVFDGVHRGHRQLIYELEVWAQSVGGDSCILTFDRHPLEVLNGVDVPAILSLETRLVELERHRVDAVVVADFEDLRDLEAEAFLEQVVRDRLEQHDRDYGFVLDGYPRNVSQARFFLESKDRNRVMSPILRPVRPCFSAKASGQGRFQFSM